MAAVTVRVLPFEVADGPTNMAADEVLLETAVGGGASLRFYGWSPPTLSLGYFQSESARRDTDLRAQMPFVRRPSGGATLVHDRELTYALALPAALAHSAGLPWLCRMHRIIAAALAESAVPAVCCAEDAATGAGDVLCFRRWTAGDVLVGGAKVVGSAQRRQRGALLQHGAVLLARSPFAPELPGIAELTGVVLQAADVAGAIRRAFTRATGWMLADGGWEANETLRRDELARGRYADARWNQRR
jgi:lipoate-protein ligase A